jgi:hypothetical protein
MEGNKVDFFNVIKMIFNIITTKKYETTYSQRLNIFQICVRIRYLK